MSKAFPLAIGAVVIVAAATTGIAWYTGTQVEPLLRQQVAEGNQQLKAALVGVPVTAALELTGFERRLFTSTAHFVTTVQATDFNQGQPLRIEAVADIEHGPFPWSRVKALKLLPVMIAANVQVQGPPALRQLLGMPDGQPPLAVYTTAHYGGTLDGRYQLVPGQWPIGQDTLRYSGVEGTFDGTQDGKRLELDTRLDSLEYTFGTDLTLQISGVSLHTGGVRGESGFYLGNTQMQAERQRFSGPGKLPFEMQNITVLGSLEELGGKLKGSADYRIGQSVIGDKPIGSAQMRWVFDNLDIAASREMAAFYEEVMAPQMVAASEAQQPFTPQLTPQQQARWQASLDRLLSGRPHIELQPLGLKTANGESHLSIALDLTKPASPDLPQALLVQQLIAKLDVKLAVAKGTIRDLVTLKGQLEGETDAAALAQIADSAVNLAVTLATLQGLANADENDILSSLHYEAGTVDFNGQKMTLEQFTAFLMGITGQQ